MVMPEIKPRSRLAQQTAAWARARGQFDVINEAIFRAYFERGEDIGQVAVLAELAGSRGLDAQSLRLALESGQYLDEVLSDERLAERYGLRGVPAFIAGGAVLFGVQPADALEEFVRLAHDAKVTGPDKGPLPHLPIKITR
jgi:predicted DsbA family dithiol-disulfide isomerase